MDLAMLKERVIDEVIRQLGEGPVTAAPAQTVAAVPAKVPASIPAGGSGGTPTGAPASCGGACPAIPMAHRQLACLANPEVAVPARVDVLVVLTGRDQVGDGLAEARHLIQQGYKAALVTSSTLLDATGPGLLYEVLQGGPAFCHGDESLASQLVKAAGVVLVPALSVPSAAQVAQLLAGDLASAVLVHAILQGKPVIAARDAVALPDVPAWLGNLPAPPAYSGRPTYAPPGGGRTVPFALRRKLEEYVSTLKAYGVVLTDVHKLAEEAAKVLGEPAPAASPAPPQPGKPSAALPAPAAPAPARPATTVAATTAPPAAPVAGGVDRDLAGLIDHTLLKPDATAEQIEKICREAKEYGFASVCVNPGWVPLAAQLLQGTQVKVCAVVGFPLGATSTTVKALEARDAISRGAREVDMVLNVGALKSGQHDLVQDDIQAVVQAAAGQALVKVILETGLLTDAEKVRACEISRQAGADFVKTSTGFGTGGATAEDVALMRRTVGPGMGVKASGGIRDRDTALDMVKAGASRLGTSASVAIVTGGSAGQAKY